MVKYRGPNTIVSEEIFVRDILEEKAGVFFTKLFGIERRKFQQIISKSGDLNLSEKYQNSYSASKFLEEVSLKNEDFQLEDEEMLTVIEIYWTFHKEKLKFACGWLRIDKPMVTYRGPGIKVSEEQFVRDILEVKAGEIFPKLFGIERRTFQEIICKKGDLMKFVDEYGNSYAARTNFLQEASLNNENGELCHEDILCVIQLYWLLDKEKLEFAYLWLRTNQSRFIFMHKYGQENNISLVFLRGPRVYVSQEHFVDKIVNEKDDTILTELCGISQEKWLNIKGKKYKFEEKFDSLKQMGQFIQESSKKNEMDVLRDDELLVLIDIYKIFREDKLKFCFFWSRTHETWDSFLKKYPKDNVFSYLKMGNTYITEECFVRMGIEASQEDFLCSLLGISVEEFSNIQKYGAINYRRFREAFFLFPLSRKIFIEEMSIKNLISSLTHHEMSVVFYLFGNDQIEFLFNWLMAPGGLAQFRKRYSQIPSHQF